MRGEAKEEGESRPETWGLEWPRSTASALVLSHWVIRREGREAQPYAHFKYKSTMRIFSLTICIRNDLLAKHLNWIVQCHLYCHQTCPLSMMSLPMFFSSQRQKTESYKWSARLKSRHPWQRGLVRFSYRKWTEIPLTSSTVSEVSFWNLMLSIFARNGCDEEEWVLMSRQPQVIRVGFTTTDNPPFWNMAWTKNKKLKKKNKKKVIWSKMND